MINNERFLVFDSRSRVQVDHNLFEWMIDDGYFDVAKKYLNYTLFSLIRETNSRVNLGDGASKTEGVDWNNLMLVPKKELKIVFNNKSLFERKILSIHQEVKQKDRKELDTKIL